MSSKTKPIKVNLTAEEMSEIAAAQKAAGYKSRSAYMRDSALSSAPVHLLTIARRMGELGHIANDVLAEDDEASGNRRLYGDDAKKSARRIIKACDAVISALREG